MQPHGLCTAIFDRAVLQAEEARWARRKFADRHRLVDNVEPTESRKTISVVSANAVLWLLL